jgi:hypothetical protein
MHQTSGPRMPLSRACKAKGPTWGSHPSVATEARMVGGKGVRWKGPMRRSKRVARANDSVDPYDRGPRACSEGSPTSGSPR